MSDSGAPGADREAPVKRLGVLFALLVLAGIPACRTPVAVAATKCPSSTVVRGDQAIGYYTRVLSVVGLSCSRALSVVRKYGGYIAAPGAYRAGGSFLLGSFTCRVTSVPDRARARCTSSGRVFRIAYGSRNVG